MDGKDGRPPWGVLYRLFLPLLVVCCVGCVEGDSGGTPVGESRYLIGPDKEVVYYRTPDGPNDFLEIDFTVASDAAVSEAEVDSFELVPGSLLWARDANSAFYSGRLVPGADPSTIQLLGADGDGSGWAADDSRVYRAGEPVAGADPATFEVFEEDTRWGRDRERVYFGATPLEEADPSTFELLDGPATGWARDAVHVYRDGEWLEGVDAATFVVLGAGYYHDRSALYYDGERLEGANVSALQARASSSHDGSNLAWDDRRLWFNGHPVTVRRNDGSVGIVDVDTLAATNTDTVLADGDGVYARLIAHPDRPAYFYQIDLVDPETFEGGFTHTDGVVSFTVQPVGARTLARFDARDRVGSLVRLGIFEIASGADVERLGCGYWRRDGRVFYYGVLVEGAVATGFSPEDQSGECRSETWFLDVLDEFQE